MTRIIKSLLGKKRQPAPEEVEALERANAVLQFRVAQISGTQAADQQAIRAPDWRGTRCRILRQRGHLRFGA